MYAVNLPDLVGDDLGRRMAAMLVAPVRGEVVQTDPRRFDEVAVVLACNDERAAAIVEVIRLKFKKPALRCYQGSGDTWRRI